jgi:asparagine synthase (glutamine-hydrolysing)
MPGIRIVYSPTPGAEAAPASHVSAAGFAVQSVHGDDQIVIDAERPDWYPIESIASARAVVCLEGHVYGGKGPALLQRLRSLAEEPPPGDETLAARVRAFADAVDGDFLVVCYDRRDQRLCVAGDRLGRLPVYYHLSDGRALIAREQRFVLARLAAPDVDRMGLAQLLLLGYPLGARTLVDGVGRLLPGEVLVAAPSGCRIVPPSGSPFASERARRVPETVEGCARILRDVFVAGCRDRRLAGHADALSLSGGMDSRAVGAGMRLALDRFSSATFVAPGSTHPDESACAAEVAGALGARWKGYPMDREDPRYVRDIIDLKIGLNPINVGFGLAYVEQVRADFAEPVAFWTGEGGDKLLCDHRAVPRRPSAGDLVRFVIAKNAVWDPETISALVGVHRDDLAQSIHAAVTACGGDDPEDAYVHFLLRERVVRWHFEGEDRHRAHVWPISPFYARDFVGLCRAIPMGRKAGRRLYRAFLEDLAPDIADIPLPGGDVAPGSRRYALRHALRDRMRSSRLALEAVQWLRRRRGSSPSTDEAWLPRLRRYRGDHPAPAPFARAAMERVVSARAHHPPNALALLLTAILAVEVIRGGSAERTGGP